MRDPKIRKRLLKSIISLICKCVNTLLAHLIHLGKHYYWFYKKITTKRVDMQFTKQTTNKTIIDHSSTKTSLDSTWVDKTTRLLRSPYDFKKVQTTSRKFRWLCQKTFRKFRRLPDDFTGSPDDFTGSPDDFVRRLPRSPDDFQTTSRRLTSKSSQKSSRSEKPAY